MKTDRCRAPARAVLLIGLLAVAPAAVRGQEAVPDSSRRVAAPRAEPVRPPAAWPALGLAAAAVVALPFDEPIARALGSAEVQENGTLGGLADGFRLYGFPGTALVAVSLYAVGRLEDRREVATLGLRGLEAMALTQTVTLFAKTAVGRNRPYVDADDAFDLKLGRGLHGDAHQSFPSGHTSGAFALAAALTAESRYCCEERTKVIAPVMFGAAVLAGLSRMYEAKHWTSDVLVGAAGGTLTGLRVVQYHRTRPGSLLDDWLLPQAVVPAGGGVFLVWSFAVP